MTAERKRRRTRARLDQPYMRELLRDSESLTPGVKHAFVRHDSWCAIFRGGLCDCDPEVVLLPEIRHGQDGIC